MKIVGISGSNKTAKPSLNNTLLETAQELAPQNVEFLVADISNLPVYSEDYDQSFPEEATSLKQLIASADAIIIATPEYNRSVPPVLVNALSWTSRPYPENVWEAKPVATMGATGGMIATYGAQDHLRAILAHLSAHIVTKPGVYVGGAADRISEGKVIDQATKDQIQALLVSLIDLATILQK